MRLNRRQGLENIIRPAVNQVSPCLEIWLRRWIDAGQRAEIPSSAIKDRLGIPNQTPGHGVMKPERQELLPAQAWRSRWAQEERLERKRIDAAMGADSDTPQSAAVAQVNHVLARCPQDASCVAR